MRSKLQDELDEALVWLLEAESIIGSPTTKMYMDEADPEHRKNWLKAVRRLLTRNCIEPENLGGRWHT